MSIEFNPGETDDLDQQMFRYRISLSSGNDKLNDTIYTDALVQLQDMLLNQGLTYNEADRVQRLAIPSWQHFSRGMDINSVEWEQEMSLAPLRLLQAGYPESSSKLVSNDYINETIKCALTDEEDCIDCCDLDIVEEIINVKCPNRNECCYKTTRNIIRNELRSLWIATLLIQSEIPGGQDDINLEIFDLSIKIQNLVVTAVENNLWTLDAANEASKEMSFEAKDYVFGILFHENYGTV